MRIGLLSIFAFLISHFVIAQNINGVIRDKKGNVLPFSSVLIKGTTKGVSANSKGMYNLTVSPGQYTLVCQYIGYKSVEKRVVVDKNNNQVIDFELENQQYDLKDVTVRSGAEDPAYAIVRKAIATRYEHLREIKKFSSVVYLKGQIQLRDYPDRLFGRKIDFQDGDTSKKKMIFLSETVANYAVDEPDKQKIEVVSTKVSGRSNDFGFSDPQIISFYENIVNLGKGLNPRGFISPIANNALNYYRYKFEGTFYESGKEISRIKVIPRRKYEPLFSGYINIIEDEWRLQSLRLLVVKEQQMQLLDTLVLEQLYVPANPYWVIKNQVIYPSGKVLGFDFFGSFVQVYDKFNLEPNFTKKFFDNTLIKFDDSSNKKNMAYWDSIRPLPLLPEEVVDYRKKDSLEIVKSNPAYLDSVDRKRNKFRFSQLLFSGQNYSWQKNKTSISYEALLNHVNYNTVEGAVISFAPVWRKRFEGRKSLQLSPYFRYGITSKHFNTHITARYNFGKRYFNNLQFSIGQKVLQLNNEQPITARNNTIATLRYENNHMKIYEAVFMRLTYTAGIGNGLTVSGGFQFQDRKPLENLTDPVFWKDQPNRVYTPNYPLELSSSNMIPHQASMLSVGINWRPGGKYIEFPDRKIGIGSNYPNFNLTVTKGIAGLFGSDVDYAKWRLVVSDELELKLGGSFNYRLTAGGFLNAKKTFIPDYQHFNGNQTVLAIDPLTGFQLAPYYRFSNTAGFHSTAHIEYHLNGLLTNKIPGFKKLNWFLIVGGSALHIKQQPGYYESMIGLENIFKIMRVDFVKGFQKNAPNLSGIRITLPFFLERRTDD